MAYYQEIEIPIRVIKNIEKAKRSWIRLPKRARQLIVVSILGLALIFSQSYIFSAYEAHVINVTARICRYSETRTIGYWKNHPDDYDPQCLPVFLGPTEIINREAVEEIFNNANAKNMMDMLRAQLLAMKFNVCNFDVGDYYVIGWGTIDYIVALGDTALTPPHAERKDMEAIKDVLAYVNELEKISHCLDIDPETEAPVLAIQGAPEPTEKIKEKKDKEPKDQSGSEVAGATIEMNIVSESEGLEAMVSESETIEEIIVSSSEEIFIEEEQVESDSGPEIKIEHEKIMEPVGERIDEAAEILEEEVKTMVGVFKDLLGLNNEQETSDEEQAVEDSLIEESDLESIESFNESENEIENEPEEEIINDSETSSESLEND